VGNFIVGSSIRRVRALDGVALPEMLATTAPTLASSPNGRHPVAFFPPASAGPIQIEILGCP